MAGMQGAAWAAPVGLAAAWVIGRLRGGFAGGMGMAWGAGAPPGGGMKGDGPGGPGIGGAGMGGQPGFGYDAPSAIHRSRYKPTLPKLAQDIRPAQMVVIDGSFPYRKQLEEFRQDKLRKRSLTELMSLIDSSEAAFEFKGFEVQRRIYAPPMALSRKTGAIALRP